MTPTPSVFGAPVHLFGDGANLGMGAEASGYRIEDWGAMRASVADGREIRLSRLYLPVPPRELGGPAEMSREAEQLVRGGWDVEGPPIGQLFRKSGWKALDVKLALDCYRAVASGTVQTVILLSGDGDFCPLVRLLKQETGVRVEVASFPSQLSRDLASAADVVHDLTQHAGVIEVSPAGRPRSPSESGRSRTPRHAPTTAPSAARIV